MPESKNRYCPICQTYADIFRPFGAVTRPDAQCPNCGSLERHRLLWCYLIQRTNLFENRPKSLLHIAPELIVSKLLSSVPNINYISADFDSPLAMVKMDLTDIQYPSGSFDVILCSHVLEHIVDDRKAMSEMHRVLKSGGWAAIQVPVCAKTTEEDKSVITPEERAKRYGQADHVRKYGFDIMNRLEEAGFAVKHENYARELSKEVRTLLAVLDEDIFLCAKL
jgi:predicted SAM-dependent methyltransferase